MTTDPLWSDQPLSTLSLLRESKVLVLLRTWNGGGPVVFPAECRICGLLDFVILQDVIGL